MSAAAEIAVQRRDASVVAHLAGEVDMTNAGYVRDELLGSMPNDALALVLELGGYRYLDSAAIEALFDIVRRLSRRRQELRLVVPAGSPLKRLLELTDLASVAPVHESGKRSASSLRAEPRARRGGSRPWRTNRRKGSATWPWWYRGSGKTSVNEALLFSADAINRLGSVADGTTVSDSAADEKAREMSISASLSSFRWDDRKINLIDTPGEPSFIADALAALRVAEGAVFVVNGVMGVEVSTSRLWERASDLGLARIVFVNMLDRERADFFRALDSLKQAFGAHVVATEIPIGSEHELEGVVDLIDMTAFRYDGAGRENCKPIEIPAELREQAEEYREKLMDEVAEVSDELMERYLEGEEISHEETVGALKTGVTEGRLFPVTCGAATRNLGINRLLDAFVEDLPSPARRTPWSWRSNPRARRGQGHGRLRIQDAGRSLRGAREPLPRLPGGDRGTTRRCTTAPHVKERIGQLLVPQGKENEHADEFGPGDIGAVAKLKETPCGRRARRPGPRLPPRPARDAAASHGVRHRGQGQGDRGEDGAGAPAAAGGRPHHRLPSRRADGRADPGRHHPDPRRGDRRAHEGALRGRGGAPPPHVPYREAIKGSAKAHARYKKQTGGQGQFADCHIEIEPWPRARGSIS